MKHDRNGDIQKLENFMKRQDLWVDIFAKLYIKKTKDWVYQKKFMKNCKKEIFDTSHANLQKNANRQEISGLFVKLEEKNTKM